MSYSGCVNVVCSDKTGTMTKNEMTVSHIVTGSLERYTIPIQQANKHSDTTCVKLDMNYANPSNYLTVTSAATPTETIKLDNVSLSNKLMLNHINPHYQMSANARSVSFDELRTPYYYPPSLDSIIQVRL